MALYIHPENQEMLWSIINKNTIIQQYFANYPQNIKETWFKQIISSFYEQNRNILVSADQLYEINKNTIHYMINDVKRNIEFQRQQHVHHQTHPQTQMQTQQSQSQLNPHVDTQNNFLRSYSVTENKEDKITEKFNEYQQNYHSMFDKKPPSDIDFREKIQEQPLNINEEIIQKHIRERDEELKRYAPPPLVGANPPQPTHQETNRIHIMKESEPIQLHVEEIDSNKSQKIKQSDITVKWLDNENSNKIDELKKEFQDFKSLVLDMFTKLLDKDGEPKYIGGNLQLQSMQRLSCFENNFV